MTEERAERADHRRQRHERAMRNHRAQRRRAHDEDEAQGRGTSSTTSSSGYRISAAAGGLVGNRDRPSLERETDHQREITEQAKDRARSNVKGPLHIKLFFWANC